jgi:cytochrome c553
MKRAVGVLGVGALLMAATPAAFGGWAVIRVHQLPQYMETGRAVRIAFSVLQHGQEPLDGLSPTVTVQTRGATGKAHRTVVSAVSAGARGRYEAALVAEDTGDVRITIEAGWRDATTALLPLRAVAPGHVPERVASAERGRALFVAAGCVTCHAKRDDHEMGPRHHVDIGPELTARQFPADWLARKLADPARYRAPNQWGMPNLHLTDDEIAALASYVNARSSAGLTSSR